MTHLPTLSLDALRSGEAAAIERLRTVSRDVGFFYLVDHDQDGAEALALARAFFELPQAEKAALRMVNSPHFRGYTLAGEELTRGQQDWREQFDIGAERPRLPEGPAWHRLQGPNQWPESLPGFKAALLRWQEAQTCIAQDLLRALALALRQPRERFDPAFAVEPVQHLKLLHYPGQVPGGPDQGVGPHKDSGFITLLQQDSHAGLQVQQEGSWVDVHPVPGTLVVNLGEALEITTNGYLRATQHRVVSPPHGRERYSVAFFLGPRLDADLPALPLPPELAAQARGITQDPLNRLVAHSGQNYLKGRLRSHPDVAARHYADLPA